jgi:lipopolysaccharide export system protein LptA
MTIKKWVSCLAFLGSSFLCKEGMGSNSLPFSQEGKEGEKTSPMGLFQAAALGGTGGQGALKIDAQVLEVHHGEQMAIAKGKAFVQYKDITLRADMLKAYYRQRKNSPLSNPSSPGGGTYEIWRLEAKGDVKIVRPSQTAYGDEGEYNLEQDCVRLTGDHLKLVSENAEVTARDSLEFWRGKGEGIALGNAVVRTKNNRTVTADKMTAYFDGSQGKKMTLKKVIGLGHVMIATGEEVATGDQGIYDHKIESATLLGKVVLQRGQNRISGHQAEVNLKTGVSRMLSGQGKPVEALLVPDQKSSGAYKKHRKMKQGAGEITPVSMENQ